MSYVNFLFFYFYISFYKNALYEKYRFRPLNDQKLNIDEMLKLYIF